MLLAVILFAQANAQYYAYRTALFVGSKDQLVKLDENENVNIPIYINGNSVIIDAESPTTYRIKEDSKQSISETNYKGFRYKATEMVSNTACLFDVLLHRDGRKAFRITIMREGELYQLIFLYDNITP